MELLQALLPLSQGERQRPLVPRQRRVGEALMEPGNQINAFPADARVQLP